MTGLPTSVTLATFREHRTSLVCRLSEFRCRRRHDHRLVSNDPSNPAVKWDDVQKQIKKACDLARKHGAAAASTLGRYG